MTNLNKFLFNFSKIIKKNHSLTKHLNLLDQQIIDWDKYINISNNNYSRNLIFKNDIFEAYLLNWKPGDKTHLHYHPSNGCIMKILKGSLNEIIVDNKNTKNNKNNIIKNKYRTNEFSYIENNMGGHIIENNSNDFTFSLHIYSPIDYYK